MDNQHQQASERIKQANNILVTVSNNPSVDQLAACIGLTVSLNKMGKHATAVFSGEVPSTLEFLQPEKTIEKNTDSLRDFIIALDKSKADKLRYKVEDRVVKIFITPYRTSITDKDLEFSQGDFNVDVVVALGVHNQSELDQAITSHGRILHDASIVTINSKPGGELGSINWLDPNASSLSELAAQLVDSLDKHLIDGQVATAFLTGIVAETERFSNSKTTPRTMSISAELMGNGANQQLVATKLEEPVVPPPTAPIATQKPPAPSAQPEPAKKTNDGTLEIAHDETKRPEDEVAAEDAKSPQKPKAAPAAFDDDLAFEDIKEELTPPPPQIRIDEHGSLSPAAKESKTEDKDKKPTEKSDEDTLPPVDHEDAPSISHHNEPPKMILEPPTLGGALTANTKPESGNELAGLPGMPKEEGEKPESMEGTVPSVGPTIMPPGEEDEPQNAPGTSFLGDQPLEVSPPPPDKKPEEKQTPDTPASQPGDKTLSDIERDVHSSHLTDNIPPPQIEEPIVPPTTPPTDTMLPPVSPAPASPMSEPILPPEEDVSSVPNMPVVPASPTPVAGASPFDSLDSARDAVAQAINNDAGRPLEPTQAINAMPFHPAPDHSEDTKEAIVQPPAPNIPVQPWTGNAPTEPQLQPQYAPAFNGPQPGMPPAQPSSDGSAPPLPPPMMPMPPSR